MLNKRKEWAFYFIINQHFVFRYVPESNQDVNKLVYKHLENLGRTKIKDFKNIFDYKHQIQIFLLILNSIETYRNAPWYNSN